MEDQRIKSPLPPRRIRNEEIVEEKKVTSPVEQRVTNVEEIGEGEKEKKEIIEKKKINIKKIAIFGGIALVVILLAGLVFSLVNKKEEEVITLNYWGLWKDEGVMNGLINDFENKNPGIKINYKKNQLSNYRSRLAGRLNKSGSGSIEEVDIFRIHNTWIPMFRNYLAPVPIESVNTIGLENDFFDIYKEDLKENGKFLSVPLMYDGLALFYNKNLIKEANIELPKTWWELESAAKKLTKRDENKNIEIAGMALGTTSNVDHWSDIVGVMMKQNGIDLSKNISNNYENLGDVLSFYCSFVSKDKVWNESLANSTQLFANGKLAFYIGPSWRIFNIQDLNRDLDFGITNLPQLPVLGSESVSGDDTKLTNIHWASYWSEGVNSKSQYKEEAWKFLEYLSSVEGLTKSYTAESQIRDFGEIYPRKSMVEKVNSNWKVSPFISTANQASSWYLASETKDDGLNSDMQKYFKDAINSILQNNDMEDTLINLQNGVNQVRSKYKLIK